jgi:DnaK suppressor protein
MARKDALLRLTTRLLARRDALRATLSGDLDAFHEGSQAHGVLDDADRAVDSANDEIFSQLAELETHELAQIERALERIAHGVCGRCEFCGAKIPAARLSALPYTTSCINCRREHERQGRCHVLDQDSKRWAKVGEYTDDNDPLAQSALDDLEVAVI